MSMDGFNLGEDVDGVSGGAEITSEQLEKYRERAKKTAAQARQDRKQEKKKKRQEDVLSHIIIQFLKTPKYSGFFILISKSLAKNIPSDFLLALLSLIHKDSLAAVNTKDIPKGLSKPQKSPFPKEILNPMSHWTTLLSSVASSEPHKVLETILDNEWKVDENITQLMSLVIREFFVFKKFKTEFSNISIFSKVFLTNLSDILQKQISNQNKIIEKSDS